MNMKIFTLFLKAGAVLIPNRFQCVRMLIIPYIPAHYKQTFQRFIFLQHLHRTRAFSYSLLNQLQHLVPILNETFFIFRENDRPLNVLFRKYSQNKL